MADMSLPNSRFDPEDADKKRRKLYPTPEPVAPVAPASLSEAVAPPPAAPAVEAPADLKTTLDSATAAAGSVAQSVARAPSVTARPDPTQIRSLESQLDQLQRANVPEDTTDWASMKKEARQLWQERSNRNDWLDLAQRIGEGLSKLYATQKGAAAGVPVGDLNLSPRIDFDAKNRQAFEEYRGELGDVHTNQQLAEQKRRERAAEAEHEFDNKALAAKTKLGAEQDIYNQDVGTKNRQEGEVAAYNRTLLSEGGRAQRAEDALAGKSSKAATGTAAAAAKVADRAAAEKEQEARQLTLALTSMQKAQDASGKEQQRALDTAHSAVAKSVEYGGDPAILQQIEQSSEVPGRLWGTNTDYKAGTKPIQDRLNTLMGQIQKLRSGAPAAATAPASQGPKMDPKIDAYSKTNNLSYEQAKAILVKRGYSPAE